MKKALLVIVFISAILFTGCGEKGPDGEVYLRITLDSYVYSYWDNNSSIPYGFSESNYYNTPPGTYSYDYEADHNGWYYYHWGTYSLRAEEGEEPNLFTDGDAGEDNNYILDCDWNGADLDLGYGGRKGNSIPQVKEEKSEGYIYKEIIANGYKGVLEGYSKRVKALDAADRRESKKSLSNHSQ